MGLLMNHLGVDGKGRVVFDAGDAGQDEEEEEELGEDVMVDLEKLRGWSMLPPIERMVVLSKSQIISLLRKSLMIWIFLIHWLRSNSLPTQKTCLISQP